jgi:hypothetical protein
MISDVLHDALGEIDGYQTDPTFARWYADPDMRGKIKSVTDAMRGLLRELHAAPGPPTFRHLTRFTQKE